MFTMKKAFFILSYACMPFIPLFFYLRAYGFGIDSYSVSIILGITAFTFICLQFVLASKIPFIVNIFGTKGILVFHSIIPIIIMIIAGIHQSLKELNGFSESTLQARLGSVVWIAFNILIGFALLFMANTFLLRIKFFSGLKKWVYRKSGLTYARARVFHNVTVLAAIGIMVHVMLASTSDFSVNPAGFICMLLYMSVSLGLYFRYRARGRVQKAGK